MAVLQMQKNVIQATCPICRKKESILLSESELRYAREQHSLITKAISHSKEGHVLTLYIDGQGIVRRKYCFEMAENQINSLKNKNPGELDNIFEQMLQNSLNTPK
ncbi:MAG: hypothetical protein ACW964_18940 [Candidatus Hodarchaeales archaeon]